MRWLSGRMKGEHEKDANERAQEKKERGQRWNELWTRMKRGEDPGLSHGSPLTAGNHQKYLGDGKSYTPKPRVESVRICPQTGLDMYTEEWTQWVLRQWVGYDKYMRSREGEPSALPMEGAPLLGGDEQGSRNEIRTEPRNHRTIDQGQGLMGERRMFSVG